MKPQFIIIAILIILKVIGIDGRANAANYIPGYNCDSLFPINCGEEFYKTHKIVNSFNPTYRCGQTPNSDWI